MAADDLTDANRAWDVAERDLAELRATVSAQAATINRLTEALKAAPHTLSCDVCHGVLKRNGCNCWKSRAAVDEGTP